MRTTLRSDTIVISSVVPFDTIFEKQGAGLFHFIEVIGFKYFVCGVLGDFVQL